MAAEGILSEFKKFILRGNVMDLAVGVIIGAAFQKIVTSLINDLVMPFIGLITGNANFNDQFLILKLPEGVTEETITSKTIASELGVTTFNYGSFITTILDFFILAIVIFILVKSINTLVEKTKKKEAEIVPAAPTTKTCPFCYSEIALEATRCSHCTSKFDD